MTEGTIHTQDCLLVIVFVVFAPLLYRKKYSPKITQNLFVDHKFPTKDPILFEAFVRCAVESCYARDNCLVIAHLKSIDGSDFNLLPKQRLA